MNNPDLAAGQAPAAGATWPGPWGFRLLLFFLLLTLLALYVPWVPAMPESGVDPSWTLALDRATELGLVFGRDVVFTHGPFHYLRTGIFNPVHDLRLVAYDSGIALALWLGLCALAQPGRGRWLLFLILALAASPGNDVRFMLVPLVFSLLAARVLFERSGGLELAAGAMLLAAMSLLGLVKGTSLVWAVFASGLAAALFAWRRRWGWACLSAGVPLALVPLFWLSAGQPLGAFPDFFSTFWEISSGYNQAMHSLGDVKESILMLLMGLGTLYWLWRRAELPAGHRAYLCLVFAVYWFFAIKLSVVRHDAHAIIGGHFALLAPLFLGAAWSGPRLGRLAAFGLLLCLFVDMHYAQNSLAALPRTYVNAARGAWERITDRESLVERRQKALGDLAERAALPRVQGRVDLYPDDCALVLAAGLDWSPRPVFQSYSAYTPALMELNRRHLLGPKAPDAVFFEVAPIDRRYPSLADGPSWPALLAHYRPEGFAGDYAILRRHAQAAAEEELAPLGEAAGRVDEDIPVPAAEGPVFVSIDMRPTLPGRVVNLVYKFNRLKFQVTLEDGSRKEFRIIPVMARAGFVVSPLVESGRAFAALYADGPGPDAPPRVRSFRVVTERLFGWQWEPELRLRFSAVRLAKAP